MNTPTISPLTEEQFNEIQFRWVSHLNMETEHAMTYDSVGFRPEIRVCKHVPFKDGIPHGRSYTHYMINGIIFKTRAKAIEYINTIRTNKRAK